MLHQSKARPAPKIVAHKMIGRREGERGKMIEDHYVETDGLGSFEVTITISGQTHNLKNAKLRKKRVNALVEKAAADQLAGAAFNHDG